MKTIFDALHAFFSSSAVKTDTEDISDKDGNRTCDDAGIENCGDAEFDRFGFSFAQAHADGNKVATDLRINGEECGQCVLRRNVAQTDLHAEQCAELRK